MKKPVWALSALAMALGLAPQACQQVRWPEAAKRAGRQPVLYPDYAGVVIPPNIAPLNLKIKERGTRFLARIEGERGGSMLSSSRDGRIVWPAAAWRQVLARNRGAALRLTVTVQDKQGSWQSFEPVEIRVAQEEVDRYLVYRLIPPVDHFWVHIGIYQRDVEGFAQRPVIENQNFSVGWDGCINCHSFSQHRTERMSLQIRSGSFGRPMIVVQDGVPWKVDTSPANTGKLPAAYHAWHPNGRYIAYSVNRVMPVSHTIGEHRDVWDEDSDVFVYNTQRNQVLTSNEIADPARRETWPSWSADGRTLYFCSAPQLPITQLPEVRYDLMRISFDPETGTWGKKETLVPAARTGMSAAQPRESPDGRWLLFSLSDHGNFPIYQPSSDLYVMDLSSGKISPLTEVNSRWSDSWHCWSSNGRWIAFASKREGGVLARIYFSYFDRQGRAHKPFVLPQKDPSFYEWFTLTYNVPELIREPVRVSPSRLGRVIASKTALQASLAGGD